MPPVRGRERWVVLSVLVAASAATGGLVGFGAGALWRGLLGVAPWPVVLTAVVSAVVLDAVGVGAWSVRRQVPQLWGRIFPPVTVALLYGSRLGIGPLTILRTWLWWAAFVVGASTGPWWSAGVGALFGGFRVAVMVAVGTGAARWQGREPRTRAVLALTSLVVAVALWWTAPATPPRDGGRAATSGTPAADATTAAPHGPASAAVTPLTSPSPIPEPVADQGLAEALPGEVLPGFLRMADDPSKRLGPLDLAGAAAVERDEPAERALLETRRFRGGHTRAWRDGGGRVAYASVYRFATGDDAEAYRTDGLTTIEARGARVYGLESPTSAMGFSQAQQGEGGGGSTVAHGVTFVRDERFFLVFVSSADSSLTPADAASAATAVASVVGG